MCAWKFWGISKEEIEHPESLTQLQCCGHATLQSVKLWNIPKLKYAPVVSINVERSLSVHKMVLSSKKHDLDPIH